MDVHKTKINKKIQNPLYTALFTVLYCTVEGLTIDGRVDLILECFCRETGGWAGDGVKAFFCFCCLI